MNTPHYSNFEDTASEEKLLEQIKQVSKKNNLTQNYNTRIDDSPSKEETVFYSNEERVYFPLEKQEERYQIIQTLGEGGMGVVHLVKDHLLGREVALKKIKSIANTPQKLSEKQKAMLWRLNQEASITAILEHPNIVPLYEMQQQGDRELCFTMRKVEGTTLRDILKTKREGNLTYDENKLLGIFLKVCDAIAYAHSKGVIHRDLKPENIMVGQFGEVYVMDWGIAKKQGAEINSDEISENKASDSVYPEKITKDKMYQTLGPMGTQGYMSPEQREDASSVTSLSDIYSLGIILKECFLLLSPLEEFRHLLKINQTQIIHAKQKTEQEENFLKKSIPKELQAIVEKSTQFNANARYQSVTDLSQDIERYQKNIAISVKEYNLFELGLKWIQRHRQQVFVFCAFIMLCSFFFLFQLWKHQEEQQKKAKEKEELFLLARKNAEHLKETAQKNSQIGTQIKSLLYAFNHLNNALSLKPQDFATEKEKIKIGEQLLQLCYETKDYQLASYVAREMQTLSISPTFLKNWEKEVELESNKTVQTHLARFKVLENKFRNKMDRPGERDDAIFELSKMQEKEIFEQFVRILKEAIEYFQNDQQQNIKDQEFYETMITAFGRLENPEAGPYLIEALEIFEQILSPLSDQNIKKEEITKQWMLPLSEALANSKAFAQAKRFDIVRKKMKQESLFCRQTELAFQKLAPGIIFAEDQAVRLDPKSPKAYSNRGFAKQSIGDLAGAIHDFDEAIRLAPKRAILYSQRGIAKNIAKDFTGAIQDFDEAIRLDSQQASFYLNRGLAKCGTRDLNEAIHDFDEAIRLNPQFGHAYLNRGFAQQRLSNFQEAIQDYDEVIRINPQFTEAYINRGGTKMSIQDFKGAILDFNEAIRLNPQIPEAFSNRGLAKRNLRDPKGAIFDFDEAIRLNPRYFIAYKHRGVSKIEIRDFEGAIQDFTEAIRLNPQFSEGYYERGLLKHQIGKWEEAQIDFKEYLHQTANTQNIHTEKQRYIFYLYPNLKK